MRIFLLLLATLLIAPSASNAAVPGGTVPSLPSDQCNLSGGSQACTVGPYGNIVTYSGPGTGGYDAARSGPGSAIAPLDVWGRCRYVDNSGAQSYFVPFKSSQEWTSFINNAHSGNPSLSPVTCAKPYTVTLSPGAGCGSPSPATQAVGLPYARTGTNQNVTANFTCTVPGSCGACGCSASQTWTQTATAMYSALNSDVSDPSWRMASLNYTGNAPAPIAAPACPPPPPPPPVFGGLPPVPLGVVVPVDGVCGSDNGATLSSTPTNLCSAGTSSGVAGSGPWTWACNGSGGGANVTCLANLGCTACPGGKVGDNGNCYNRVANNRIGTWIAQYHTSGSGPDGTTWNTANAMCAQAGLGVAVAVTGHIKEGCNSCNYGDFSPAGVHVGGSGTGCNSCGPIDDVLCKDAGDMTFVSLPTIGTPVLYNYMNPPQLYSTADSLGVVVGNSATAACKAAGYGRGIAQDGRRNDGCNGCTYTFDTGTTGSGCNSCGAVTQFVCSPNNCP